MTRKKVDVPKRIISVVNRCRTSGYLIRTMPVFSDGEGVARFTYADGSDAPDISVRQAIERGLIAPAGDGLFGSDQSQTFRVVEP